ncbi:MULTISPECIES: hypothetical protein [Corallococcus]|uniref:hypothetical protein n=1 Tax=Corallococcus TaxID=83461 RepID=UPI0011C3A62E|nr:MULTISPECIES: hypothetical protein [Corallococcus]NPC68993.1 hypothetical protein [Corallococcus exiguus]NPD22960.1 hypothetical protein [Corallococcus exiguus]
MKQLLSRNKVAVIATVGLALSSAISFASVSARTPTHDFTQADVDAIVAQIRQVPTDTFYIRLPTFSPRGGVNGSRLYGTLPLAYVRRMASVQHVALDEQSNIMGLVMDPNTEAGMASGEKSRRVALAIDAVLADVTPASYQFLR